MVIDGKEGRSGPFPKESGTSEGWRIYTTYRNVYTNIPEKEIKATEGKKRKESVI
jgi:hypothetical protein